VLLLLFFVLAYFDAVKLAGFLLVMTPLLIFILIGACYAVGGLIWMVYCLFKESEGNAVWRVFKTVCKLTGLGLIWIPFIAVSLVVGLVFWLIVFMGLRYLGIHIF
jgi:hypothetical protein